MSSENAHIDVDIQKSEETGRHAHPTFYQSIWISDAHLGTSGCKAEFLLDFLKNHESKNLYLVGDIIDGWQLTKKWYWNQLHNDVIQKVLRKARKGTRVVYIVGNHDEGLRNFLGISLGNIQIVNEAEHTLLDGRRFLILHGDLFDGIIKNVKWIAHLGDFLYVRMITINNTFNRVRRKLGFPYWSLSQYLKQRVKKAINFVTDFENAIANEAKRRGFDGVVCGHIHKAEIRDIGGVLYCNDGDWVESLSALVETKAGELKLIHWPFYGDQVYDSSQQAKI